MRFQLPNIAKKHPVAFWVAVVLHVALLVGLIFAGVQRWDAPKPSSKTNKVVPKAITIDLSEIKKEKQRMVNIRKKKEQRLKDLQRAEKKVENERYKEQQRLKKLKVKTKQAKQAKILAEKKRKSEERKTKQALKQKKLAEKKALEADKKRQQADKKKRASEKKALEADKKRQQADKKKRASEKKALEADKKRQQAENKKKLAERNAKLAEKKKQAIEKLRKVASKKFEKDQNKRALKNEIQAEEDQDRTLASEDILNELKANYINQIAARVKEQWRYSGAKDNWGCDVSILQDIAGNVKSVNVHSCTIDDSKQANSFKNSIEHAARKASPLPAAPDKGVFDHEIVFQFRVN